MIDHLTKKFLLAGILIVFATMFSAGSAKADSLQIYCTSFDDTWFTTMQYGFGFCYPGTWGDITVTRADATFGAALSIGQIGEGESPETMDEQFRTDNSGRNMPFGTSRAIDGTEEEFKAVPLGDFASRSILNSWLPVFDDTHSKTLGHRQEVSISYRIRQGKCYATFAVSGKGPLESKFYYGILLSNASTEAAHVTETMKNIGVCGGSAPSGTAPNTESAPVSATPEPVQPAAPLKAPTYVLPKEKTTSPPKESDTRNQTAGNQPLDEDQAKRPKDPLDDLQGKIESVHSLTEAYQDVTELGKTVESMNLEKLGSDKTQDVKKFKAAAGSEKPGKLGSYGGLDAFTDAVKTFNDYRDLREKGVTAEDAAAKATLDNFGVSLLTLIPVLKAIDVVAATPDTILEALGVGEENGFRKYGTKGVIGKFSPSHLVEQTTDLMIEDGWGDIGNTLAYGAARVVEAEGVFQTIWEAEKLTAAAIGAVPVAAARAISDLPGAVISAGQGAVNFVAGLFTF